MVRHDAIAENGVVCVQSQDLSPNDPIMLYYGACLFSRLQVKDKSVGLLKDAVNHGYQNFEWIKRDPDFENIRNESGYIKLMQGR